MGGDATTQKRKLAESMIGLTTVATDVSLNGVPGRYAAYGYAIVQQCFDYEGECQYGEMARYQPIVSTKRVL